MKTHLLRLLNLPAIIQQYLDNGDIEMGHARALLALSESEQLKFAQLIIENNLSDNCKMIDLHCKSRMRMCHHFGNIFRQGKKRLLMSSKTGHEIDQAGPRVFF